MRSDANFVSLPTTGTMDKRERLLAQLGDTLLKDIQEILVSICLHKAAAKDGNNSTKQDNEHVDDPQDDLKALQKNGVKGKAIGTRRSGHPMGCAVFCLLHCVSYLQCQSSPIKLPIASYHGGTEWRVLKNKDLTNAIRASVRRICYTIVLRPEEVSTCSLCTSGAMTMILGGIDCNVIQIFGQWKSETMLCYLHISAEYNHTRTMLRGGHYGLLVPTLST